MFVHERGQLPSSGTEQSAGEARPIPRWGLRQFTTEAREAIRAALPDEVWVEATILSVAQASSGYTLDLIEPDSQNFSTSAQLRGYLPSAVAEQLVAATGEPLEVTAVRGSNAWVRIRPTFHPSRHLQAAISDLEPVPALGILDQVREETRLRLIEDGVFCRQRQLPEPIDILRIGIIHPERSAGYADVRCELERMERTGIATSVSFPASFEGSRTRHSLCAALKQARDVALGEGLDVLLVVRGGGHSVGLASLVFEDVARLICTFPVPVITGLGHATDHTLLDEIAWRSADTPSKAIGLVLDLIRSRAEQVMIDYRVIRKVVDNCLSQQAQHLKSLREQLLRSGATCLQEQEHQIEGGQQAAITCRVFLRSRLDANRQDLERLFRELIGVSHGFCHSFGQDAGPIGLFQLSLEREGRELERMKCEITCLLKHALEQADLTLQGLHREIRAFSIEGTLERGFALALDQNCCPIRHLSQLSSAVTLMIAGGSVHVRRDDATAPNS
ncbi:exodeoxyribonuclease VII large subunit [Microvirga guangxiensis]|uniref:Exodeoxyribonuclease VII, large subunit n=1 Tax=Microvirga guangxiensis TaxID=549386 RepID=A0A1G5LIT2_9HYPH|nr:exodeoxyribonuclease VII large subunit [Microvirga guangxiensis]SCZ12716.1 exodeoxyribonuclease VII, large subunit [Microvirga guangxiensis]